MSKEMTAIRINDDGSQQNVSLGELRIGNVILRDGKRMRITTKEIDLQELATGRFQFRDRGDENWYAASTRGIDTLYAPVEPPDAPYGECSGKWIIPDEVVTIVKVVTFQEVPDS